MEQRFAYVDETDKGYGVAGMAVSLVVWNAEHLLVSVSLDDGPEQTFCLDPQFFDTTMAGLQPRAAWNTMVANFRLSTAMLLANLVCRHYMLKDKRLDGEDIQLLLSHVRQAGAEHCSLEQDECEEIFNRAFVVCDRVFSHYVVQEACRSLVAKLRSRRRLKAPDVFALLQSIQRL